MKKTTLIIVGILLFAAFSYSQAIKIGGTLGYRSVTSSIFQDLYGSGAVMFGGSLAYEALPALELRGEIRYFKAEGTMNVTDETIKLSIVPLVLGFRYSGLGFNQVALFLGAGIGSYRYKETARIGDTSDSTLGYHVEGGLYIFPARKVHFDVYVRYVKAAAEPFDETIELGGLYGGIGIGFRF